MSSFDLFCLFSVLTEVGNSSKSYCELAGRTEPVIGDVIMALVNMGYNLEGIQTYSRRSARTTLPQPVPSAAPKPTNILQAGSKQKFPSHIPNHMPEFPDPHAYIRTPVNIPSRFYELSCTVPSYPNSIITIFFRLTSSLSQSTKLLEKNQHNIKGTWKELCASLSPKPMKLKVYF